MTRHRLPSTRYGLTHKFTIHSPAYGCVKGFFTVNIYEDGEPGELFIHLDSMDESTRGNLRCLCLFISVALQNGMPISDVINKLRGQRFEPAGFTENPLIPNCTSIVDYIARWFLSLDGTILQTLRNSGFACHDIAHNLVAANATPEPHSTSTGDTHVAQTTTQTTKE